MTGMAYNFQKYNLDRIQYLGAPYDTGCYITAFLFPIEYIDIKRFVSIQSPFCPNSVFFSFHFHSIFSYIISFYYLLSFLSSYCHDRWRKKAEKFPSSFSLWGFQSIRLNNAAFLFCSRFPHETGSVMHYDAFAFAKNRERPTIITKKQGTELGQRRGFSDVWN